MSTNDRDDGSNASVTVDIDLPSSTFPIRSSTPRQNSGGTNNNDNNNNNNNNNNKNNRSSQAFSVNSSQQNNTLTSQNAINTLNAIRSLQKQTDSVDAWMPDKEQNVRPDGLPTLDQVLRKQTFSPLSQFNLYTYLRVRQKAEENLNFWNDIEEHERLWKQYETAEVLRRQKDRKDQSRRESDRAQKKRERLSQLLGPAFDAINNEDNEIEMIPDLTPPPPVATVDPIRGNMSDTERETAYEEEMKYFESRRSPTLSAAGFSEYRDEEELLNSRRGSRSTSTLIKDPVNLTFSDMLKNAEKIYRRYCSPFDTSNSIPLPEEYRLALHELIEIHKQPHPLVFQSAKLYTEELIDNYYYQKFLDSATKSNLTRVHSILSLFLGVIALTAGFSLELVFIFLGSGGYTQRAWGLIPLLFGWLLLITAVEKFLVILALFRYSETTFFRFHRIKEPAIQKCHNRKALRLIFIILLATVITTGIFIAIPPHTMSS